MAATHKQPDPSELIEDERARKRIAIGLAPSRPTAKERPLRPPDEDRAAMPYRRLLSLLLVGLIAATLLLLAARLLGAPTHWRTVAHNLTSWVPQSMAPSVGEPTFTADGFRVLVQSGFGSGEVGLPGAEQPGQYRMGSVPDAGLFRIQTWPNQLAWTTPGSVCLAPHRLEADAVISSAAPDGYAGLVARVTDSRNFYLFAVDGQGRFQVLLQRDGIWHTLRPWTAGPGLQLAGSSNLLALDDDGATLRFSANGVELFSSDIVRLPAGYAGLAAGAERQAASVDFDWFALYDRPCRG